jgi:hypothetical protein
LSTLFNENTELPVVDPAKNYLEELVGEGKKFKSPEDLARGKFEADNVFIPRLQKELEELRQELNTRMTLEQYMEKMTAAPMGTSRETPTQPAANTSTASQSEGSPFKPEDIEELVSKKIEERERERVQRQNLQEVQAALIGAFGNDYVNKLTETAQTLGLDKQTLDHLAKTQPKAFFRLVGIENMKEKPQDMGLFTPPATRQSTSFAPQTQVKNQSFYSNLRKTDPKTYWSPSTQNQMHVDAARLGQNFYT